jgi:hypothetical protein
MIHHLNLVGVIHQTKHPLSNSYYLLVFYPIKRNLEEMKKIKTDFPEWTNRTLRT